MDAVNAERQEAAASLTRRLAVMRKAKERASGLPPIPEGGGSALPSSVKARMEPKLGADLSGVRVHTAGESSAAAKDLGARAFTVGSDVHFGSGEFSPGTKEGDRLIAHELTHVVQGQKGGVQRKADSSSEEGEHNVSHPDEPAEKEADATGDRVASELHAGNHERGKDATAQKPARIAAKFIGVGNKLHRAPTPGAPAKGQPTETDCIKDLNHNVFEKIDALKIDDPRAAATLVELEQRVAKWKTIFTSKATAPKAFGVLETAEKEIKRGQVKVQAKLGTAGAVHAGVAAAPALHGPPATSTATGHPTAATTGAANSHVQATPGPTAPAAGAGSHSSSTQSATSQPPAADNAATGARPGTAAEQWCTQHMPELQALDPKKPASIAVLGRLEQEFSSHSAGGGAKVEAFREALLAHRKAMDEQTHTTLASLANNTLLKISPDVPTDYAAIKFATATLHPYEAVYGSGTASGLGAAYYRIAKTKVAQLSETFQNRHDAACQQALASIQKLSSEQPDFQEQLQKVMQHVQAWLAAGLRDPAGLETRVKAVHKEKLEAGQKPKAQAAAVSASAGEGEGHASTVGAAPQVKPAPVPTNTGHAPTASSAPVAGQAAAPVTNHANVAPHPGGHAHALQPGDDQRFLALQHDSPEVKPQFSPSELRGKITLLRANPQWGPVIAQIPDEQLMALIGYTAADYRMLNEALRGERDSAFFAKIRPYIALTQDALARLPHYVGVCWRGCDLTPQQRAKYKVGKEVEEPGFFSASYDEKRAFRNKTTKYTIDSKRSKIIDFLSHHAPEKECLFMAGSRFIVLNIEEKSGTCHIQMREV